MEHSEVRGNAMVVLEITVASVHLPVSSVKKYFYGVRRKIAESWMLGRSWQEILPPPPQPQRRNNPLGITKEWGRTKKGAANGRRQGSLL